MEGVEQSMLHQHRLFADSEGVESCLLLIFHASGFVCVNVCFPFRGS